MKKLVALIGLVALVALFVGPVAAAQEGPPTHGCDQALENDGDPYDSTCDGSPSQNGNGIGNATGRPCAGCVGAADNKNPRGQFPDGTDPNNGYECDGNNGVGKTNPAHTGCDAYTGRAPAIEPQEFTGSEAFAFDQPEEDEPSLTRGMAMLVALTGLGVLVVIRSIVRRRIAKGD
jgi:hypothetical protein